MRKICKAIILYVWGTGVFIPWVYYKIFGYVYVYEAGICPTSYFDKAGILLTISFGLLLLIIHMSSFGRENINFNKVRNLNAQRLLYVCTIFYALLFFWTKTMGGYNAVSLPRIVTYFALFIEPVILFILCLFTAKSLKRVIFYCSVYLLISVLSSSRSGIFWIFIFVACYFAVVKLKIKMRTIIVLGFGCIFLAVPLYISSTANRYGISFGDYMLTYGKSLFDHIIGRLSFLELGGCYLYTKDVGLYDAALFNEKYSFSTQILQSIDSFFPGTLFSSNTIQPNQYIRSIFFGYPIDLSESYYTSINMTAPIYLVFKYAQIVGTVIFAVIGYSIFRLGAYLNKIGKWHWSLLICILLFRDYLLFFDWVTIISRLVSMILTIGFVISLNGFYKLRDTGYVENLE